VFKFIPLPIPVPIAWNALINAGQAKNITAPIPIPKNTATIGTKRSPAKNARTFGILML